MPSSSASWSSLPSDLSVGDLFLNNTEKSNGVTFVAPTIFESPVKRLNVSGGSAAFFSLRLKETSPSAHISHSVNRYIGKDLSHATDETAFYNEIISLKQHCNSADNGLIGLLGYTFEYLGVLRATDDDGNNIDLLVLQNLHDRCKKLRLLDLKIGQRTSSGGWQGKSHIHALRQEIFDKVTNSTLEGYRLEGFDGQPPALLSLNPHRANSLTKETARYLLEPVVGKKLLTNQGENIGKKQKKLLLQGMEGAEIFIHFLDLHHHLGETALSPVDLFTPTEVSEIIMHELVCRLVQVVVQCHKVLVPQKWIGSSVGLGFDCENTTPTRSKQSEKELRESVLVNLFDWGRSELNTFDKHQMLSLDEKIDRKKFWELYKDGMNHLAWIAARTYMHRFGNSDSWRHVTFSIFDFETKSKDNFIGTLTVPVHPTDGFVEQSLGRGSLSFSISWHPFQCSLVSSRLKGVWRISVGKGINLNNHARETLFNPYCVITARSGYNKFSFEQMTTVKCSTANPVWNELVDLPVAKSGNALGVALEVGGLVDISSIRDVYDILGPQNLFMDNRRAHTTLSVKQKKPQHLQTHFHSWVEYVERASRCC